MRKLAILLVFVLTITFTFHVSEVEVQATGVEVIDTIVYEAVLAFIIAVSGGYLVSYMQGKGYDVSMSDVDGLKAVIRANYKITKFAGVIALVSLVTGESEVTIDTTNDGATPEEDTDLARDLLFEEPAATPLREQFIDWYKESVTWSSSYGQWKVATKEWSSVSSRFYTVYKFFDTLYDSYEAWPDEYKQFYNEFVSQWDRIYQDSLINRIKNYEPLESGELPFDMSQVDLNTYGDLVYIFEVIVNEVSQYWVCDVDGTLIDVEGAYYSVDKLFIPFGNSRMYTVYGYFNEDYTWIRSESSGYGSKISIVCDRAGDLLGYIENLSTPAGGTVTASELLPSKDETGAITIGTAGDVPWQQDEEDDVVIEMPGVTTHDEPLPDTGTTTEDLAKEQTNILQEIKDWVQSIANTGSISVPEDPGLRPTPEFSLPSIPNLLALLVLILIQILLLFIKGFVLVGLIFKIPVSTTLFHPDTLSAIEKTKALTLGGFNLTIYELLSWIVAFVFTFILLKTLKRHLDTFRVT